MELINKCIIMPSAELLISCAGSSSTIYIKREEYIHSLRTNSNGITKEHAYKNVHNQRGIKSTPRLSKKCTQNVFQCMWVSTCELYDPRKANFGFLCPTISQKCTWAYVNIKTRILKYTKLLWMHFCSYRLKEKSSTHTKQIIWQERKIKEVLPTEKKQKKWIKSK